MGPLVSRLKSQGTTFTEVNMDWWLKHPEVPGLQAELAKIVGR
jgi:hypothetical protein